MTRYDLNRVDWAIKLPTQTCWSRLSDDARLSRQMAVWIGQYDEALAYLGEEFDSSSDHCVVLQMKVG